jgi:hypothetical protein
MASARLTATVVVPTPPLGEYTTISRRPGRARRGDQGARAQLLRAPVAQVERLDAGVELALVDRADHHVVGAGLEQLIRSSTSSVELIARIGTSASSATARISLADIGSDRSGGDDVKDDDVVLDGPLFAICSGVLDTRQGPAGAAQKP